MKEFIKELEQLPQDRKEAITKGLQNQIIAQAIMVRDEQPEIYLSYLDSEIESASNAMLKMVKARGQDGAILGNISEVYIWNKERKRLLMELRDKFVSQQPQSLNPEPQRLVKELTTPEAKAYFKKAIDLGLMDSNFRWLKGRQMLACFAREMSLKLNMGKGDRIAWKPFEMLFGVTLGKLRLNYNDIQKTGQDPKEAYLINRVFE